MVDMGILLNNMDVSLSRIVESIIYFNHSILQHDYRQGPLFINHVSTELEIFTEFDEFIELHVGFHGTFAAGEACQ